MKKKVLFLQDKDDAMAELKTLRYEELLPHPYILRA